MTVILSLLCLILLGLLWRSEADRAELRMLCALHRARAEALWRERQARVRITGEIIYPKEMT